MGVESVHEPEFLGVFPQIGRRTQKRVDLADFLDLRFSLPIDALVSELDEILGEFLVESYENLDRLDQDLVALEDNPTDTQLLSGIFRTIHTIKGTCGFLGFSKLEALTHAGENLLSRMRDGDLLLNPAITNALLAMVDGVREMLGSVESTGGEGDGDYSELTHTLHVLLETNGVGPVGGAAAPAAEDADEVEADTEAATEKKPAKKGKGKAKAEEPTEAPAEVVAVEEPAPVEAAPAPTPAPAPAVPAGEHAAPAAHPEGQAHSASDSSIRVDVSLLDTLMNLVGELVLARNQIIQVTSAYGENDLAAAAQRLNLITTELQEGVMKTRMQPIGSVLSKFPRVVRDIAVSLGKQVRVELEGKETELDKTINEAIKDPLTHLVRNSVDHGLEMPDVRIAKGKNPEGRVVLRAFHEGGQVNIEIEDDGAGIDHEIIKRKGVEKGLVTQAQADRMTEREALQLIFYPGFSTAAVVSNISGRGVGMDVVKTNIESIGGTVDVQTVIGKGTTFKIKIPLTLAIIPALLVGSDDERYAIPQVGLVELLRVEGEQARESIEMIYNAPVYRLRGNLLPLCHLGSELAGTLEPWSATPIDDDDVINIVVLQADGRQFGMVVDKIWDTQEIVVKPLDTQLKNISAFAGATIMGDGRVALILDVLGLAKQAHMITEGREKADPVAAALAEDVKEYSVDMAETLLLLQAGDRRVAVPLSLVDRLEEFPHDTLEMAAGRLAVQYRDGIMPLLSVSDSIGAGPGTRAEGETVHVVVYASGGRHIGLTVDTIIDIVTEQVVAGEPEPYTGVRGSVVIQSQITDIVDVVELIGAHDPAFFIESTTDEVDVDQTAGAL